MHYLDVAVDGPRQRRRVENGASEVDESGQSVNVDNEAYRNMQSRLQSAFPSDVRDNTEVNILPAALLRTVGMEHDKPHPTCGREGWHIAAHFGKKRRYGLYSSFFSTAIVDEHNPPDVNSELTYMTSVQWAISDHVEKKFYRFSQLDSRFPYFLSVLMAQSDFTDEPHMLQALVEQLENNAVPLPDQLMPPGAVSSRLNELNWQCDRSYIKFDTSASDVDHAAVTASHRTLIVHLEGRTAEIGVGDSDEKRQHEVNAVVELAIRIGPGPFLEGDHGIVRDGLGAEDEELFAYSYPFGRIRGGLLRLRCADDDREVGRELDLNSGNAWVQHYFGEAVPRAMSEAQARRAFRVENMSRHYDVSHIAVQRLPLSGQDRRGATTHFLLRFFDSNQSTVSLRCNCTTSLNDSTVAKAFARCTAIVHHGMKREAFVFTNKIAVTPAASKSYRSPETGVLYPTMWTVRLPWYDGAHAELQLSATFAEQEFVTVFAQPSFYAATLRIQGTLHHEDGTQSELVGEGNVECTGLRQTQPAVQPGALFDVVRGLTTATLEKQDSLGVSSTAENLTSPAAFADGPALSIVSTVAVLARMQGFEMGDAYKVVLAALLGTYAYVYQHGSDEAAVRHALEYCHGKWVEFFGSGGVRYSTLALRAFMLRELGALLRDRCPRLVAQMPGGADCCVALDLVRYYSTVAVPSTTPGVLPQPINEDNAAEHGGVGLDGNADAVHVVTEVECAQLKALMEGIWHLDLSRTRTSEYNFYLLSECIDLLGRNHLCQAVPTMEVTCDVASRVLRVTVITPLSRVSHEVHLQGTTWDWRCPVRGAVTSRSCLRAAGHELHVTNQLACGVEQLRFAFTDNGHTMEERCVFYNTDDRQPVASCTRYFTLQLNC